MEEEQQQLKNTSRVEKLLPAYIVLTVIMNFLYVFFFCIKLLRFTLLFRVQKKINQQNNLLFTLIGRERKNADIPQIQAKLVPFL